MRAKSAQARRTRAAALRPRHSWRTRILCSDRLELIYPAKIDVSGDQDLYAIPLALRDGRGDRHGALEHFRGDLRRTCGIHNGCPVVAAGGLHARLNGAIHNCDEDGGSKALPEVPVDLTRKSRAPQLIG